MWLRKVTSSKIIKSDVFLKGLEKYPEVDALADFREFMAEEAYSVGYLGVSYRQVNYWDASGLLLDSNEKSKWRKFSRTHGVWVKLIDRLKEFGLEKDQILGVQKAIFGGTKAHNPNYLNFFVYLVIKKIPCYLIYTHDGLIDLVTNDQYEISVQNNTLKDHIKISLNGVVLSLFDPEENGEFIQNFSEKIELSKKEEQVLRGIRSGQYDRISIRMKDGEIDMLEGELSEDVKRRIIDLLKLSDFQRLVIDVEDGKPTRITRIEKEKLK